MAVLTEEDRAKRLILHGLIVSARELDEVKRRNLAIEISNARVRAQKGSKSG
jgi:hypothetical protein